MSTLPPESAPPASAGHDHDALPPGTRFGEFEIRRVLGVGGFGIVYLAHDHSLEREVALKEYMPASLAARGHGPQITVRSSSFAETYAIGLRSFVNEARLLARFDHPSLVKVYRFWEDNATAYMVMPFLQGTTLRDTRRRMAHPPDEPWIRSVISPILAALELLHREGVYHRDIAPDNILLPHDGPPVLLDFGAARRVISDRTQSLTAILKPSYAPIEQYAEMTQLRQGPWTDLYALGAVIHYLLFGAPPAPATARAVQDDIESIENRIVPGVSPRFLEAVSWMLSVRPNQRPQNGEQLRAVLDGSAQVPARGGRPGITIPPTLNAVPTAPPLAAAHPPSQPLGTQQRQIESSPDATMVNTAHYPTHLPTARMPPPGRTQPPPTTTFSPTAQMPTARTQAPPGFDGSRTAPPPVQPPPMGSRTQAPHPEAGASPWPTSRPATLSPPMPPQGRGGHTLPPAGRPSELNTLPPPILPRTRPAPLAAPVPPAASAAKNGSSKAGLVIAGVVGLLVIAAAAAWQFQSRGAPAVDVAASAAPALTPPVATTTPPPAPAPVVAPATQPVAATDPVVAPATTAPAPAIATNPPAATTVTGALAPAARSATPVPGVDATTRPADRPLASAERPAPTVATAASNARPRPPAGQPVPRDASLPGSTGQRPGDGPTFGGNSNNPYGTSPYGATNSNANNPAERPQPLGQPPARDPYSGRPVPPPMQATVPQGTVPQGTLPQGNLPMESNEPATVKQVCAKKDFLSKAICVDETCELPRFRNTSECTRVLERKRQRENR